MADIARKILLLHAVILIWEVNGEKKLLISHRMTSHMRQVHMVGESLSNKGHQVYSVIQHGLVKQDSLQMKGIQPIYVNPPSGSLADLEKHISQIIFEDDYDMMQLGEQLGSDALSSCKSILYDHVVMKTLNDHHFDLVVMDQFTLSACNYLVPYVLNASFVSVGSAAAMFVGGTPSLPSFVPFPMFPFSHKMTLLQRLVNFVMVHMSATKLFLDNSNTTLLHDLAPNINCWYHLMDKSLLHLIPRDFILDWPTPHMPNVIRTPGITIAPAETLPENLQNQISSTDLPVILATFGYMSDSLPVDITRKFVAAFSQVNYTIIWRLNSESSSQVVMPDNVHVVSWLPQNDLLGHPATKLFITHCGNNGQYEAVYHGVPMIGFPLFAEQPHNCFRMEDRQFGKCMDIRTFDPDALVEYIKEVAADDSIYHQNVDKRSAILRDIHPRPLDTIVRWIEHVITHGGEHLHSHAVDMPWYQYWMLDVLTLILGLLFALVITCNCIINRVCTPYKQKQQ